MQSSKRLNFLSFSFALLFLGVGADPKDYLFLDVVYFVGVVAFVLAFQLFVSIALDFFFPHPIRTLRRFGTPIVSSVVFLAFCTLCNTHFFLLINVVMPLPVKLLLAALVAAVFLLSTYRRGIWRVSFVFSLGVICVSLTSYGWQSWQIHTGTLKVTGGPLVESKAKSHTEIKKGEYTHKEESQPYAHIAQHNILEKRNIYLLFIESMAGRRSLKEIFGVEEAVHFDYLRTAGFHVFDGLSAGAGTYISFARWLSHPVMIAQGGHGKDGGLRLFGDIMTGKAPSITYDLLRNNGYQIQGIFAGAHRGKKSGVFDYSFEAYHTPVSCDYVSYRYLYFGCMPRVTDPVQLRNRILRKGQWGLQDAILERLETVAQDELPWFTLLHHPPWDYPVHTNPNAGYSWDNQTDRLEFIEYYAGGLDKIKQAFEDMSSAIRKHDPDGIIIFAGDHGPQVTRGATGYVPYRQLDSYSVGVAVSPADFCRDKLKEGVWLGKLMEHIVTCLSAANNPYIISNSYDQVPDDIIDATNSLYPP
jgi:hypothetical protein